mmetsp:Transcript_16677/g.31306  ORF Transcript_16677/g.31306 Transcript_16677/m.31306 type:complete len:318 (+) Transcript_16677:857-1810(+)
MLPATASVSSPYSAPMAPAASADTARATRMTLSAVAPNDCGVVVLRMFLSAGMWRTRWIGSARCTIQAALNRSNGLVPCSNRGHGRWSMSCCPLAARKSSKATATWGSWRDARCMTNHSRSTGLPASGNSCSSPASSSSRQVCSDTKATPKPAAHICLIASLLDSSEPMRSAMPSSLNSRSSVVRVPEPRSRASRCAPLRSASDTPRCCISGCPGDAMNAIGCFAKALATVLSSRGGRPMITRSTSWPASMRAISSRLPTRSLTFTFGCSSANLTSSGGSRYSAVVTAPTRRVPENTPRSVAISSPTSRHRSRMRPA